MLGDLTDLVGAADLLQGASCGLAGVERGLSGDQRFSIEDLSFDAAVEPP